MYNRIAFGDVNAKGSFTEALGYVEVGADSEQLTWLNYLSEFAGQNLDVDAGKVEEYAVRHGAIQNKEADYRGKLQLVTKTVDGQTRLYRKNTDTGSFEQVNNQVSTKVKQTLKDTIQQTVSQQIIKKVNNC